MDILGGAGQRGHGPTDAAFGQARFLRLVDLELAEDLGAPGGWINELHQQLERRRLAGAVRAEEADDLAGLNIEGYVVQDGARAVALGDVVESDHIAVASVIVMFPGCASCRL